MRKKLLVLLLCFSTAVSTLTGCSNSEIAELNDMGASQDVSDIDATDVSLSNSAEDQNRVYKQVSERKLLNLASLEACESNDITQVNDFMSKVDNQLVGYTKTKDGVIDESYINYLLSLFQVTPYYWQKSSMTIRGMDASSRDIIVDVTYKTIDYKKKVKGDSQIVKGSPNYDKLMSARFNKYVSILEEKYSGGNASWRKDMNKFESVYGKAKDIYKQQANESLADQICDTGNQVTYKGCVDSEEEKSHGTMTIRYILVPDYELGINLGLACKHLYVTNFKLDKDPTEGLDEFNEEGYDKVTDKVYATLYSYFNCIDESDFNGLYKLTSGFEKLDKYYQDMFNNSYSKHSNMTISLFNVTGTNITCGVKVSTKTRGKGTNMTYPIYQDSYFCKLSLVDGILKVQNITLLSRELEGEPVIRSEEADVNDGFASSIDLDNTDKQNLENIISKFAELQLKGDTKSDDFGDTVDISMTQSELTTLKEHMTSITGEQKSVYIDNYLQGTNGFASIRCKEYVQDDKNVITQISAIYGFILKGGVWYLYSYDIDDKRTLDSSNLNTVGALCYVTKADGEVSHQSQVTESTDGTIDSAKDISVTYDYAPYTPSKKKKSVEEGVKLITTTELTSEDIDKVFVGTCGFDELSKILKENYKDDSKGYVDILLEDIKTITMIKMNYDSNRYSEASWLTAKEQYDNAEESLNTVSDKVMADMSEENQEKIKKYLDIITELVGD